MTAIQKLAFHLPNVNILGTRNRGKEFRNALKLRDISHDVYAIVNIQSG